MSRIWNEIIFVIILCVCVVPSFHLIAMICSYRKKLNRTVEIKVGQNVRFNGSHREPFAAIVANDAIMVQRQFFNSFGNEVEVIEESLGEY